MKDIIYLDNNNTTNLTNDAKKALVVNIKNIESVDHNKCLLERCKNIIIDKFNIDKTKYNVIFTFSSAESNKILINSTINIQSNILRKQPIIITSLYEQEQTISHYNNLEKLGACKIIRLKPNSRGLIEPEELLNVLNFLKNANMLELVCIISIIHVDVDTGSKNTIYEISKLCKHFNIPFHSDISHSIKFGQFDMDMVDAVSFSFHEYGGPKGAGVLIFNKKTFSKFFTTTDEIIQNNLKLINMNINVIFSGTIALMNNIRDRDLKNIRLEIMRNEMLKILSFYFDTYYYHEIIKDNVDSDKPIALLFGSSKQEWRNPNTIFFAIRCNNHVLFNNDKVVDILKSKHIFVSKGNMNNPRILTSNMDECLLTRCFRISLGDENLNYQEETINAMHEICITIQNQLNYHA